MKSPIDFTLLCDRTEGYAVLCTTEEEADLFMEWAHRLYPGRTSNWKDGETRFATYGEETVYTFNQDIGHGCWQNSNLLFGPFRKVQELGYTIIPFSEIYRAEDIAESDQSISMLLV